MLGNLLITYPFFCSSVFKTPSCKQRTELVKCEPQLSPCAHVVAPWLVPSTRIAVKYVKCKSSRLGETKEGAVARCKSNGRCISLVVKHQGM